LHFVGSPTAPGKKGRRVAPQPASCLEKPTASNTSRGDGKKKRRGDKEKGKGNRRIRPAKNPGQSYAGRTNKASESLAIKYLVIRRRPGGRRGGERLGHWRVRTSIPKEVYVQNEKGCGGG